jgi:hypothetical protein
MRNNVGFPNRNTNMGGVDTQFNTWDLTLTPAAKDFLSIADPSVSGTGVSIESSGALGPRAADGGMPNVDFLKLAAGSQMIDKGTDVGLPFVGAAPDLGAYEHGAVSTAGTGGASTGGSGGAKGTGGSGGGKPAGTGGKTTAGTGGTATTGTGGGTTGTGGTRATGGDGSFAGQAGTGLVSPATAEGCSCELGAPSERDSLRCLLTLAGAGAVSALRRGRRRRR